MNVKNIEKKTGRLLGVRIQLGGLGTIMVETVDTCICKSRLESWIYNDKLE